MFAAGCVLLLLSACKKKEIQGPKGDPGTPGGGGNADLTSSTIFSVTSNQWEADTVADYLKVVMTFTAITKDVVDNGAVRVFIRDGSGWADLPSVKGDLITQFGFEENKLTLKYVNIEGGLPAPPVSTGFRMVIHSKIQ